MSVSSVNSVLLGALVDDVINPRELRKCKDFATKLSKSNQFGRVNQFEVEAKLDGLVEKFYVLNRSDLASGLEFQRKELTSVPSKWQPDILALLLHLSDLPVKKTVPYEPTERPGTPVEVPLTWKEILQEDPVSDEDLWVEESYSSLSSDDDDEFPESPNGPLSSGINEASTPERKAALEKFIVQPQDYLLLDLTGAQFWTHGYLEDGARQDITEIADLYAIRETILMLRGLPTSLFKLDHNGIVSFNQKYSLYEISKQLLISTMQTLAEIGTRTRHVKSWVETPQNEHSIQRFQAVVRSRLQRFYTSLNEIEQSYTSQPREKIVSLIEVSKLLSDRAYSLLHLEAIIARLLKAKFSPFLHLELLYDATCIHQAAGNDLLYEYMAKVFFETLSAYLRPIQRWVKDGELGDENTGFFIALNNHNDQDKSSIWHDRYHLRTTIDDKLFAPKFIHASAQRILNAGKSVIFLTELGVPKSEASTSILNYEDFHKLSSEQTLAPFASLFHEVFSEWIQRQYTSSSALLRQNLFKTYGLDRQLHALHEIYFSSDGSMLQSFIDPMLEALDRRSTSWNDRFLLLERFQTLHNGSKNIDIDRVTIRVAGSKQNTRSIRALSVIVIDYTLSWPLLNVIRRSSLPIYQRVFRLLLQIYRVKYLLRYTVLMRGTGTTKHTEISVRQDLQCFVDTLYSHVVNTILKPASEKMHGNMSKAEDINEMTDVHDAFIQSIQTQCLFLKNLNPIYHAMISILELGVRFTDLRRQMLSRISSGAEISKDQKSKKKHRRRSSVHPNQVRRPNYSHSSDESSENEGDPDYDADTEKLSGKEGSYDERMGKIKEELTRLRSFVVTGLRGISRTGGEVSWEMLADQLDWGSFD